MLLCLQYQDDSGKNLGGLYLNSEHIISIRSDNRKCKILTSCGIEYSIVHSISNVLDMLNGDYEE